MVLILVLQMLQRVARFLEDLVLPHLELAAEIVALPLVHERLFTGRPLTVKAVMGLLRQRMAVLFGDALLLFFLPQHSPQLRAPSVPARQAYSRRLRGRQLRSRSSTHHGKCVVWQRLMSENAGQAALWWPDCGMP